MRSIFVAATLVVAFFLGLGVYNHIASAGDPSITHHVGAGSWGAEAYPSPSISSPWTEGESYTGHGTALAALRGSFGDFFYPDSEAVTRWDFEDKGISVTIESRSIFGGKWLYEKRSYPYAVVYTYLGEYLDGASAYSSGWIYMYSSTDDWDNWPKVKR